MTLWVNKVFLSSWRLQENLQFYSNFAALPWFTIDLRKKFSKMMCLFILSEISGEYDRYVEKKRSFDIELSELHRRMDEYNTDISKRAKKYRDCQPKV